MRIEYLSSSLTVEEALQQLYDSLNLRPENCRVWIRKDGDDDSEDDNDLKNGRKMTTDITDVDGCWRYLRNYNFDTQELNMVLIDLMIEQKTLHPRTGQAYWPKDDVLHEWKRSLRQGDMIDARDEYGTWYESVVSSVNLHSKTITIHFKGWGKIFDRELSTGNQLITEIAPLYTRTENWRDKLKVYHRVDYTKHGDLEQGRKWLPAYVMSMDHVKGLIKVKYLEYSSIISEVDGVDLYGESICQIGTHVKSMVGNFVASPVTGSRVAMVSAADYAATPLKGSLDFSGSSGSSSLPEMERQRLIEELRQQREIEENQRIELEKQNRNEMRLEAHRRKEEEEKQKELEQRRRVEEERMRRELEVSRMQEIFNESNALAASLMSHAEENDPSKFANRTKRILQSLPPPLGGRIRQCLEVPKGLGGSLVGSRYKHAKEICRHVGGNCRIDFLPREVSSQYDGEIGDVLLIEADADVSIKMAEDILVSRLSELLSGTKKSSNSKAHAHKSTVVTSVPAPRPPFLTKNASTVRSQRHIFVNSSDIFFSAPNSDPAVRINTQELAKVLILDPPGTRIVVGTKPVPRSSLWDLWKSEGFTVYVNRDADIIQHLQSKLRDLVRPGQVSQDTVVLCVGKSLDKLEDEVTRILGMGWKVEIWTWQNVSTSSSLLPMLMRHHPRAILLHDLDAHINRLLFRSEDRRVEVADGKLDGTTSQSQWSRRKGNPSSSSEPPAQLDDHDCIICMDQPRTHLLVPCGHLIACVECIKEFSPGTNCPICRQSVTLTVRLHNV